ncbi:MAG: division/cell wall cluster transcriptional repressor MraZ [Chloroflexota bacterium]|nr:division/cell wall cluster transcriptional repressor MraZ [Chloroflexota bacterium]
MFLGQYTYTLDTKGRLIIPSRFREGLTAGVVVTRGLDRCLTVYPLEVWEEIAQKVNALPITSPQGRALRRLLFADASDAIPDRQGRILIPERLREYAELPSTGEVVVVGLDLFLELWNPQRWAEENARELEMMGDDPALWENLQI